MWLTAFLLCLLARCSTAKGSFELQNDDADTSLILSTLDGSLICLEGLNGEVRWEIKEEPVVRAPMKLDKGIPLFLPDPRDGSLYMMGGAGQEALQKLPFTIPQLVASSPCRSSDGILYSGKKLDSWFSINPKTGVKKSLINALGIGSTCPREGPEAVYIGRTEYNILMMDTAHNDKMWNVTFYDYASYELDDSTIDHYNLVHFTGSSSGRLVTLSKDTGALKWQYHHGSPIIGMYVVRNKGLHGVPFTSIAETTLDGLIDEIEISRTSRFGLTFKPQELKLLPTLYVGEYQHGLYALPSLVDESTATIEIMRRGPLLLEGAIGPGPEHQQNSNHAHTGPAVVILGHYKVPDYSKTRLQITGSVENRSQELNGRSVAVQTDEEELEVHWNRAWELMMDMFHGNISTRSVASLAQHCYAMLKTAIAQQDNAEIKAVLIGLIIFVMLMAWRLQRQMRDIQVMSQGSRTSSFTGTGNSHHSSILSAEETSPGVVKIGKITLFTDQVLGKGCEGTFVFKGEFDSRPVAVKRVLPECFTFADREVNLLRESDAHVNVVRYFCTEQDKQFRYIALELCAATVSDYVKGNFKTDKITAMEILVQSTSGLAHLHSLDIVHRDMKPHNVLLSMESKTGEVRAMISDFGLCKKLAHGKTSFSLRSGVTGTEGWIAPEVVTGETSATFAVDIFSMGCIFYYVLTGGKHPFGESLHRQANILQGNYNLAHLTQPNQLAVRLIERMIAFLPTDRPSTSSILKHPLFWSPSRILTFFQDISDRIEKENDESFVLKRLEESCGVLKGDWRLSIDSEVAQDLRKYRNYRGDSVRDLLRALRNKKHHYRELSKLAQKNLGEIPVGFVDYWTGRFPLLLLHSWLAMQCVKREAVFRQYYDAVYTFPRLPYVESPFTAFETEGFHLKKPSSRGKNDLDTNWRVDRRGSDCRSELVLLQEEHGSNTWFQQWFASDFRDNNAYIRWQEQEYYKRKTFHQSDEEVVQPFQPEFPTWEVCDRFRKEKRVLEEQKLQPNLGVYSNINNKSESPRRFRRRPQKKTAEDGVVWSIAPSS